MQFWLLNKQECIARGNTAQIKAKRKGFAEAAMVSTVGVVPCADPWKLATQGRRRVRPFGGIR
jgi:hypothetical protein